jgi:hypothetical protein
MFFLLDPRCDMIAVAKSGTAGFAPIFSFYLIVRTVHAYMNTIQDASNRWLIDNFCIMHFIFPLRVSIYDIS